MLAEFGKVDPVLDLKFFQQCRTLAGSLYIGPKVKIRLKSPENLVP